MDLDTGMYPYTDGFNTTTGAVCIGLGVPEEVIETTVGVLSAVSAIRKDLFLAEIAREFPTRIKKTNDAYGSIESRFHNEYEMPGTEYAFGWTDLNLIRHAEILNKLSSIFLTHLDVLNDVETIKLCKRYHGKDEETGAIFEKSLPTNIDTWEKLEPDFKELPGWQQDISGVQSFSELPVEAQAFVRNIETISKQKVEYVSVNDTRDEGILRIMR